MNPKPIDLELQQGGLSAALPQLAPEILEAKMQSLRAALGVLELSVARRQLPPRENELHPPFEILLTVDAMAGEGLDPPPVQAFDRVLGEACSFRVEGSAAGGLATWLREKGGGVLCGWALPRDRWPSVAVLARAACGWDPGPVRLRVAQRGMEALARSLSPPSWWIHSVSLSQESPCAGPEATGTDVEASLSEAKLKMERELIQQALRRARGNKAEAARRLQLSRQGLYRKLRRHGLHGAS